MKSKIFVISKNKMNIKIDNLEDLIFRLIKLG